MKQLTWSVGKYACLGKDEQDKTLAYTLQLFDGKVVGIIEEGDREKRFDTVEEAKQWCEAQL